MVNLAFRRAIETDLPTIIALLADDILGATREEKGDNHRQYIDERLGFEPSHIGYKLKL